MTQAEFNYWLVFYRLYPFDDLHRFHRPAALIGSAMNGDLSEKLDWLQPDPRNDKLQGNELETLRAFGFKGKQRKGG